MHAWFTIGILFNRLYIILCQIMIMPLTIMLDVIISVLQFSIIYTFFSWLIKHQDNNWELQNTIITSSIIVRGVIIINFHKIIFWCVKHPVYNIYTHNPCNKIKIICVLKLLLHNEPLIFFDPTHGHWPTTHDILYSTCMYIDHILTTATKTSRVRGAAKVSKIMLSITS